ncbi:MAG: hypothetical protein ACR2PO_14115 [Methyloligellaceae bacterium]
MRHLSFLTTAIVFAGLIAAHATAAIGHVQLTMPEATVAKSKSKCGKGSHWDKVVRLCVPVEPRGSF